MNFEKYINGSLKQGQVFLPIFMSIPDLNSLDHYHPIYRSYHVTQHMLTRNCPKLYIYIYIYIYALPSI